MRESGVRVRALERKPAFKPETIYLLNVWQDQKYFNNNLYDYCQFAGIYDKEERAYLLTMIDFISKEKQQQQQKQQKKKKRKG